MSSGRRGLGLVFGHSIGPHADFLPEAPFTGRMVGRVNGQWTYVVPIAGATMPGPLFLAADPVLPNEAATKGYADAVGLVVDGEYY